MIKLDLTRMISLSVNKILDLYTFKLAGIRQSFFNKTSPGSEMLGWVDFPNENFYNGDYKTMHAIQNNWINKGVDTVIVIGIGGSSIGSKAVIDMCTQRYTAQGMDVIFVSGLHTTTNVSLLSSLTGRNWALVYISKSGTTFESKVNFRLFREKLYEHFGDEYNRRITIITNENSTNSVGDMVRKHDYYLLTLPVSIGGRFSTITAVGLFPMLLAGIDIDEILRGWKDQMYIFKNEEISKIEPMIYAAVRHYMLTIEHKAVEVFHAYENNLWAMSEHYKQIFAESEGKKRQCLIPTIANDTEDLHSIGQLYQQGPRNFFETTLMFKSVKGEVLIPKSSFDNDDGIDNLEGKNLLQLNYWLQISNRTAHDDISNLVIKLDSADEYHAGALLAWFVVAAATSARLIDVNPFDQPGVEKYKKGLEKFIK